MSFTEGTLSLRKISECRLHCFQEVHSFIYCLRRSSYVLRYIKYLYQAWWLFLVHFVLGPVLACLLRDADGLSATLAFLGMENFPSFDVIGSFDFVLNLGFVFLGLPLWNLFSCFVLFSGVSPHIFHTWGATLRCSMPSMRTNSPGWNWKKEVKSKQGPDLIPNTVCPKVRYTSNVPPFLSQMWIDPKTLWPHDSPYWWIWYGVWCGMIVNKVTSVQLDYFQTWFWT